MAKTQIGLGVLSIPDTFDKLGIVPGVLCLIAVSASTTWSGYMVGSFKRNHPDVYSLDEAGFKMFGVVGREVLSVAFMLCKFPIGCSIINSRRMCQSNTLHHRLDLCCWICSFGYLYWP